MQQWGENIQRTQQPQLAPARILVMGPAARNIAGALVRMKGNADICHAESAPEAIEILSNGKFAHILIDNLADGALTLTIARLAQLDNVEKITVLAGPNSAELINAMPGIATVLQPPFNPIEIASSLDIEIEDSRKLAPQGKTPNRRNNDENENDAVPTSETAVEEIVEEYSDSNEEELDDRPTWMKVISAIFNVIPGLTPIISTLYKHLALTILAGLFVAFVSYGVMIVYFLTSGDWSSPLQLQRGHELVAKTDRERNELQIKLNLVTRQISDLETQAVEGKSALQRANTLASITAGTIDQEITNRNSRAQEIGPEIQELEAVIGAYGTAKTRAAEIANVQREYRNRTITKRAYQTTIQQQAQLGLEVAKLRQTITEKKNIFANFDQATAYLKSLKEQIRDPNAIIGAGAISEFIPLTNQLIEVRQTRSRALADIKIAEQSLPALQNSKDVLVNGIIELEKTPMFRALKKPVNVLFVPYDNIDAYLEGKSLYACAFAIFWCTNVGEAGKPIGGEISTNHPFFGKPIRGQFVEANLTDPSAAKKEIIHVGRAPLFF